MLLTRIPTDSPGCGLGAFGDRPLAFPLRHNPDPGADRRAPRVHLSTSTLRWVKLTVVGAALLVPTVSHAQAPVESSKEYRRAFESMKQDLTNPERSFEFVEPALVAGDVRGAIAALERILKLQPGLGNIKLELGVLYLRVGYPELAAAYLKQALLSPEVPPMVRERAQELLARAQGDISRHFFSGQVFAGGRYDTNANAAPASRDVRVFGEPGVLAEDDTGRSDFSGELAASVRYLYGFESQAGHQLEVNAATYNRRYTRSPEVNVDSVGFDVGPRFYFGSFLDPHLSIRPFLSASILFLDDEDYLRPLGGGLNFRKVLRYDLYGELTFQAEDQQFYDTTRRPTASDRSGLSVRLFANLNYQLRPATLVWGALDFGRRDAEVDFESLNEGGFLLGVTQTYAAPFELTPLPWNSSLSVGLRRAEYDEPDPTVDPDEPRKETRLDLRLSTDIRISEPWTVVLAVQYTDNDSDIPNFDYHNIGGTVGAQWAF